VEVRTQTFVALALALALITLAGVSSAVTVHVPAEQPTIQQGIAAAAEGDTVLVAPDTYTGSLNRDLDFGGTNVVLVSEGGYESTIIDCESSGRGFFFHSGEDTTSVVSGFMIANAVADTGAGAYCAAGSSPRFESCKFVDGTAQGLGGGLHCGASSPVVDHCVFARNVAVDPSRIAGYGGGVSCMYGSAPRFADTTFSENNADRVGGGFYSYDSSAQLIRCQFVGNLTGSFGIGGGATLVGSDGAAFTQCAFQENGTPNTLGGGLLISGSAITVTDCSFRDNIAGAAAGIRLTSGSMSTITGCTFVGNTGAWNGAGAIECHGGSDSTITNCTFVGSDNHHVWLDGASPTIEYCILAFSLSGLAVYCEQGTETPNINHCFVFGNEGGDVLCGGNFTDIEYADPRFCDIENGNVRLCEDSPCLPGVTWPSLVGSQDADCDACGSATEQRTWGRIKATYR